MVMTPPTRLSTRMAGTSLHSEAAARNAAMTRLRDEHRALARVIEALESITAQIVEAGIEPDFGLLAAMLYYLDVAPDKLHHPKEDRYLFRALREHDPGAAPLIERLEREHRRSPELVAELERTLVHWQGGAPDGRDGFAVAVARFCEFSWAHMRTEEAEILPAAERCLDDADWMAMAEAFSSNDDPLFGLQRRAEFDRLYHRIANLSPRKLKLSLLKLAPERSGS
ncbi:MAG: hemerythrin domain-containing protein [Betaproteobacteria bacterium]|nr:MAG: hemerythrin domain-containing protein [Betaproteobacteria bacterium]